MERLLPITAMRWHGVITAGVVNGLYLAALAFGITCGVVLALKAVG